MTADRLQTVERICAEQGRRTMAMASLGRISLGFILFLSVMQIYGLYYRAHVSTPLLRAAAVSACPVLPPAAKHAYIETGKPGK